MTLWLLGVHHLLHTCKRFSTQQLSEPNHVSNCVSPAWFGVGGLKSVCESHPYFIRALNFSSNSPCSCEVCKIKEWRWTMEQFQKRNCHWNSWLMFTCSVEQRNSRSSRSWNRKTLNRQWKFWRQFVRAYILRISSPTEYSVQSRPPCGWKEYSSALAPLAQAKMSPNA